LKGYPPVKQAYTNCTAPTYTRKTRKASMMRSELGALAWYEFQSSVVALERLERERDRLEEECVTGGLEEGAEETVEGASDLAVFLGAMVSR
jgi:hypothetical protein